MGKTFKDKKDYKVLKFEEKGFSPRVLKEEYKRERIDIRDIKDVDDDTDGTN